MLYDDRLDGRIDAATYDRRAKEAKAQEQRIRQRLADAERVALPPASEAIDLMAVTSGAAERFLQQPAAEQRRLLNLIVKDASWKAGGLRMSLREPFEQLRVSNSASRAKGNHFDGDEGLFGMWR